MDKMGISRYPTVLFGLFVVASIRNSRRKSPREKDDSNRKDHVKIFEKNGGKMSFFFLLGEIYPKLQSILIMI